MISAAAAGTVAIGELFTVHRLGFGAMRLTGRGIFGPPANVDECRRVLRRTVELGVNFIDTADSYGPAIAEELIADALYPYPEGLVIATKGGLERPGPDIWKPNGRPEYLRAACNASLKRLRVERIDLYQLHRIDPAVPEDEQFGVIAELKKEGKIRSVGLSEVSVREIARARKLLTIVSVQNRYSITDRTWEPVLKFCQDKGIAFIPWYPLGGGSLGAETALQHVARRHGATVMQMALAWLLARSPVMLPIPGTSKTVHLEQNVAAASIKLTHEELAVLDAAQPG
jgi:pyridoxine 4-dehydrogenase